MSKEINQIANIIYKLLLGRKKANILQNTVSIAEIESGNFVLNPNSEEEDKSLYTLIDKNPNSPANLLLKLSLRVRVMKWDQSLTTVKVKYFEDPESGRPGIEIRKARTGK